jgi:hypothetical protein
MKRLFAIFFTLFAGIAFAQQMPQNCSVPAGTPAVGSIPGNPGFSVPITTQLTQFDCGPNGASQGHSGSPTAACLQYLANIGQTSACISFCNTGSSGSCAYGSQATSCQGANVGYGSEQQAGCPAGTTVQGNGTCKSNVIVVQDAAAATYGNTITRNANGLPTQITHADGRSYTTNSFDTSGLPNDVTNADGSHTTIVWTPNSALPYQVTNSGSTLTFLYNLDGQTAAIKSTEGNVLKFDYSDTQRVGPYGKFMGVRVSTATKDCNGTRSGKPIACGAVVGPDPELRTYLTVHQGTHEVVVLAVPPASALGAVGAAVGITAGVSMSNALGEFVTGVVDACKLLFPRPQPQGPHRPECTTQYDSDTAACFARAEQNPSGAGWVPPHVGPNGLSPSAPGSVMLTLGVHACLLTAQIRLSECNAGGLGAIKTPLYITF